MPFKTLVHSNQLLFQRFSTGLDRLRAQVSLQRSFCLLVLVFVYRLTICGIAVLATSRLVKRHTHKAALCRLITLAIHSGFLTYRYNLLVFYYKTCSHLYLITK